MEAAIDLLQKYYGLAKSRSARMDVVTIRKAIWATYLSTDEKPQHGLCPTGDDDNTWCNYQKEKY